MFQPQATPLDLRSSYGRDNTIGTYNFEPSGYAVSAGGPIIFETPAFSSQGPGFTAINNSGRTPYAFAKMDDGSNYQQGDQGDKTFQDQMSRAEQESLKYEPEVTGRLVGEKKSCQAITEEYARGDPIYVAKTAALPQTYSHYRPIRGDGNCGWRAIACGYFETLALQGDAGHIHSELARLMSFNNLFARAGFDSWVYDDMVDCTFDLLKKMATAISEGLDPNSLIIDCLNDPETSNAIVYHLRLMASSTLRLFPAEYEPFIPDGLGVEGYCKTWLEPSFNEIEHLGMSLLVDALLKPVGIAVEIVYLDRSEGDQVNTHRFGVDTATGVPTIHLLYRPGHYDILYKHTINQERTKQILDEAARHSDIQVHRASSFAHQHEPTATNPMAMGGFSGDDMSILSQIPGFSLSSMNSHHGFPSIYSPISNPLPTPSYAAASPISPHPMSYPTANPTTTTLPLHPVRGMSVPNAAAVGVGVGTGIGNPGMNDKFRMSTYEYEAQWQDTAAPPFQTASFKNSHYNTAHYNNPNFHPEQWLPESEDGGGSGRMGASGRHHSS